LNIFHLPIAVSAFQEVLPGTLFNAFKASGELWKVPLSLTSYQVFLTYCVCPWSSRIAISKDFALDDIYSLFDSWSFQ